MIQKVNISIPNPSMDTFPKLLQGLVARKPEDISIREKDLGIWQSWTWREYMEEASAVANSLAKSGFNRGDKVAIIGDNRPELYFGIMASQMLGGVPILMFSMFNHHVFHNEQQNKHELMFSEVLVVKNGFSATFNIGDTLGKLWRP